MAEVIRLAGLQEITQEAARRWLDIAQKSVAETGKFTVALAGGNTPRNLYTLMATPPQSEQAPWLNTYVFWGDERRVPASHSDSNYRMARETLLDHVPVPADHIFRMQGEGLSSSVTQDYTDKLHRHFNLAPREWPSFDLILLGLGADGHFASIFPGTRAASDITNMVIVYEVPQLRVERVSLTRPVFNSAKNILFLVCGEDKAAALANALSKDIQPSKYPAQNIAPENGNLTWLVDKAAASLLK